MNILEFPKYTMGIGDRFGREGTAQLQAFFAAREQGISVCPVWNKSFREHSIVKTQPDAVREEADAAVKELGWDAPYFVDADHIRLETVGSFIEASDFYTIDVADSIGKPAPAEAVDAFAARMKKYEGNLAIPGMASPFRVDESAIKAAAQKFLLAVTEAGAVYRYISEKRGGRPFVTEISMDETDSPQTPLELFLILAMAAGEKIPVQTIAPKFTGRFNKGVDYVGDLQAFEKEFDEDLCVIEFAIREFQLPGSLKISLHSGSDKFSLYPIINRLLRKHGAGIHVKTAGTTWLEEVIGLAESGGEGLEIAREIYAKARERFDELTAPYATVIDIDKAKLPANVNDWSSETYVRALRHDPRCAEFNPHFRQLIHVGFKVAAEMCERYHTALTQSREAVARNVTENLLTRHLLPIFGGLR
jgi:hypothetical protein